MNNLPKESRKINLLLKEKPIFKLHTKPLYKMSRIKSQDDINNLEKNDSNLIYPKNTPKNPMLPKNILIKNTIKKLNKNNINDIINQNKPINRTNSLISGSLTSQNKQFTQSKSLYIEQGNDIGRVVLTNTLYDDIKIRNIISLWNELEVMESYRKYFFFIYKEIDEEDKINFYQNEINELIQLKNDIKNLTYNIELRFGIVKVLSELNNELNNEMKKNPNKTVDKFVINEIIKKLEDLSIHTVNIVLYMKKIKSIINLAPDLGKYNIDLISRKYNFDKNYVIKMKLETNFLKEGYAKQLLNIKDDQTPFFIKANSSQNVGKNNYTISLDQKVINCIKECNYYIYKELIAYENDKEKRKIFRCISPIRKNAPSYNFYSNVHFYSQNTVKNRENKNENLFLNLSPSGKGLAFKSKDSSFNSKSKRNSMDNLKLHNSAKLIPGFDSFSSNNTNINKNNKIFSFDMKLKDNERFRQRNKNSDFVNFQSDFNKNNINKSEVISSKIIEYSKSKQVNPSLEIPHDNGYENHKENKNEYEFHGT